MKKLPPRISWNAISLNERHKDIDALKRTISLNGGDLMDFNLFSDLGMGMRIEVEERNIERLFVALQSVLVLTEGLPEELNPTAEKEWVVNMHVTFAKGTGDLAAQIPNVPG